jgi:aspartate ammonia-lyase
MNERGEKHRIERDPMGEKRVPADALYGVQTLRALENFRISPLRIHPGFVTAYAEIKKAAAEANMRGGQARARARESHRQRRRRGGLRRLARSTPPWPRW